MSFSGAKKRGRVVSATYAAAKYYLFLASTVLAAGLLVRDIRHHGYRSAVHLPSLVFISLLGLYTKAVRTRHIYEQRRKAQGCGYLVEYPHRDPWGLDFALTAMKHFRQDRLLEEFAIDLQQIGHTYRVRSIFKTDVNIQTDNVEITKTILATSFDDWAMPVQRKRPSWLFLGHDSIFAADGKHWSHLRAMLRPAFQRSAVGDLPVFDKHISRLVAKIDQSPEVFDLQELFGMMTMDSTSDFMFGRSTATLVDATEDDLKFMELMDLCSRKVSENVRTPFSLLFADRERDEAYTWTRSYVTKYVDQSIAELERSEKRGEAAEASKYIFLPELVRAGGSRESIRDQIMTMFFAGRDTNTGALGFLFWHLARQPRVVEKIQQEIARDIDGRELTWEMLRNMRYLNWAIKEALRLNPALSMNARVAVRDTFLPVGGGPDGKERIFCPEGTLVRWVTWAAHRNRAVFGDDAEDFRPERWESLKPTWEYLPFSGGPRICIGQQFAQTQIALTTVRLLQHFKTIEPHDDRPPIFGLAIATMLKNGCRVSMRR